MSHKTYSHQNTSMEKYLSRDRLLKRAQFGKDKHAVYKLIDYGGFVQIEAIYVVERAHQHSIDSDS